MLMHSTSLFMQLHLSIIQNLQSTETPTIKEYKPTGNALGFKSG